MKIFDFLKSKRTEEMAAELRARLIYVFGFSIGFTILFWVFKKACVTKLGFWYGLWSFGFRAGWIISALVLLALVVLWLYLLIYSICDFSSTKGSAIIFPHKTPQQDSAEPKSDPEPGEPGWQPTWGDWSDF